jgi:hypothetical protein
VLNVLVSWDSIATKTRTQPPRERGIV